MIPTICERKAGPGKSWSRFCRPHGRYIYRYIDAKGIPRFVYSWTLTQSDRTPKGKQSWICLRELEKSIAKDLQDEIDTFNARKTRLDAFCEDCISDKKELKKSTRSN
ncbi:MAG: integrase DNA-binding domain-containing protein [Evtepia sp.]|uniref:integrase DNA-binding domain-containing protein n=1 Tax=Evtepia sp. TaxID=2773933 RepID=UPI002A747826|nr:integrase DNA-binding domain-containing protein [Evtepia sp.]MDY3014967.1 integrase DNA-binding domain-containing protein [Evtepia sp.]